MESVGATFNSGLVEYCTTFPIFIDVNVEIHLEMPGNVYIFAWAAGTRNNDRAQKRQSAPTPDDFVLIGKEVQNKSGRSLDLAISEDRAFRDLLVQVRSLCAFFGICW